MILDGLGEILKQKYDPNYKDEAKTQTEIMLSEIKAKNMVQKKKQGKKVGFKDLL